MDAERDPRNRRRSLLIVGVSALCTLAGRASSPPQERRIELVAKRFVFLPDALRLKRDEAVVLHIAGADVPMGFSIPDLGLRTDLPPDQFTSLRLKPDRAGRFVFLCDVFCGSGHESMNGTLTVTA